MSKQITMKQKNLKSWTMYSVFLSKTLCQISNAKVPNNMKIGRQFCELQITLEISMSISTVIRLNSNITYNN